MGENKMITQSQAVWNGESLFKKGNFSSGSFSYFYSPDIYSQQSQSNKNKLLAKRCGSVLSWFDSIVADIIFEDTYVIFGIGNILEESHSP